MKNTWKHFKHDFLLWFRYWRWQHYTRVNINPSPVAGKSCCVCMETVFQQIACFVIRGLLRVWCLSLVVLLNQFFTAHSAGRQDSVSRPVIQPSITARSIFASFTKKLFANPTNGSVQRLYLSENLLSDSVLFRRQHVNVILGYLKGFERGNCWGSCSENYPAGCNTSYKRLQEGGCCVSQEQQLHQQWTPSLDIV